MYGISFWNKPQSWPIDYDDKVFIARAVGSVGRALHGAIWTGKEALAATALKPDLPIMGPFTLQGSRQYHDVYSELIRARPDLFTEKEKLDIHRSIVQLSFGKWSAR